jgi:RNA polymerase sigma-70 factor (ECF subfamily)
MEQIAGGDMHAFEQLFDRFKKPLLNYFYRQCWDAVLAEDCLQEIFMRIWRAAPNWKATAKVSTWVFTIARNFWINEAARARKRPTPLNPVAGPDQAGLPEEVDETTPDAPAQLAEQAQQIKEAIDRLPDHEREVVLLHQYQNFPYQEIADILEIPLGTVKSRMNSALNRLRKLLEPTD